MKYPIVNGDEFGTSRGINRGRDPHVPPYFLDFAAQHASPLRAHAPVRYLSDFHGQWCSRSYFEQIGVPFMSYPNLSTLLATAAT